MINDVASSKVNIYIVLDKSSSMQSVREATISGFNEFIQSQAQETVGEASVTLVQFGSYVEGPTFTDRDVREVPLLNWMNYVPNGMTALYDAIGSAIDLASDRALSGRAGKNLIVIITDGGENSSRQFTRSQIFDLISKRRNNDWDFVFIGANQDAFAVGSNLGVAPGYTFQYDSTPTGIRQMTTNLAGSTRSYRGAVATGQSVSNFFDQDKDKQSNKS